MSCTGRTGVALVGRPAVGVALEMVDLADLGGDRATGVCAGVGDELCGVSRGAGEQPSSAAEVDDDACGVDDGASHVAVQHRPERLVFGYRDAGRGLAAGREQIVRVFGVQSARW